MVTAQYMSRQFTEWLPDLFNREFFAAACVM